jgi:hypothetical protein
MNTSPSFHDDHFGAFDRPHGTSDDAVAMLFCAVFMLASITAQVVLIGQ